MRAYIDVNTYINRIQLLEKTNNEALEADVPLFKGVIFRFHFSFAGSKLCKK